MRPADGPDGPGRAGRPGRCDRCDGTSGSGRRCGRHGRGGREPARRPAGPAGPAGAAGRDGALAPRDRRVRWDRSVRQADGPGRAGGRVGSTKWCRRWRPRRRRTSAAFASLTGSATCPAGKIAIAGGYEGYGDAWFMYHYASYPSAPNTWTVSLKNRDSGVQVQRPDAGLRALRCRAVVERQLLEC